MTSELIGPPSEWEPPPEDAPDYLGRRTMAELAPREKDLISHLGQAFRALIPALQDLG